MCLCVMRQTTSTCVRRAMYIAWVQLWEVWTEADVAMSVETKVDHAYVLPVHRQSRSSSKFSEDYA